MPVIECENVTKEYRLGKYASLISTLSRQFQRILNRPVDRPASFKALDGVTFAVEHGEVLGIIGHNGAGKSTLLKILAGITTPTSGRIQVHGRIAPLIEVGAGFVPTLTGRENVYLNGAILGLSRQEITRRFDEIVDFAEIEEFIDTPVKRYSSGMQVKLAFSVATSIDSEILIVDEVLAVGDLAFQQKCIERMERMMRAGGRTVLIVGHNIRQIERICSKVMLLDHGRISMQGPPRDVCGAFYTEAQRRTFARHAEEHRSEFTPQLDAGVIRVTGIDFLDDDAEGLDNVGLHEALTVRITFETLRPLVHPEIVVGLHTSDFVHVLAVSNALPDIRPDLKIGKHVLTCRLSDIPLRPFSYSLRLAFLDQYRQSLWYAENLKKLLVTAGRFDVTRIPEVGLVDVPTEWHFSET